MLLVNYRETKGIPVFLLLRMKKEHTMYIREILNETKIIPNDLGIKLYLNPSSFDFDAIFNNAETLDVDKFTKKYNLDKNLFTEYSKRLGTVAEDAIADYYYEMIALHAPNTHNPDDILRGLIDKTNGNVYLWDAFYADHEAVREILNNEYNIVDVIIFTIERNKKLLTPSKFLNIVNKNKIISNWNITSTGW